MVPLRQHYDPFISNDIFKETETLGITVGLEGKTVAFNAFHCNRFYRLLAL
jgi:hypothetical protein